MTSEVSNLDTLEERFALIVNGPALFNAMIAGLDLGVFEHLKKHPGSNLEEIATAIGIHSHKARVLLLALCASGLLRRKGSCYSNDVLAERHLVGNGPSSWHQILKGWHRIYYPAFAMTTDALLAGTNIALETYQGREPTLYQRLAHHPDLEHTLHRSMSAFTLRSMDGLLDSDKFIEAETVLDVGGGDGTTALALIDRYPHIAVTVFDTPTVAAMATESAVRLNLENQITACSGDLLVDDLPNGYDIVLFSHVLEIFNEHEILKLLVKGYNALDPGGKLLVYGFVTSANESGGLYSARLSLYLNILASGTGMAYPTSDWKRWMMQAGCENVQIDDGLPYDHALIVGTKPH